MRPRRKLEYAVHPVSAKHIIKGHPWVTLDKFSAKFPNNEPLIIAMDGRKPVALLINDPEHKTVKARVWLSQGGFKKGIELFPKEFIKRLDESIRSREKLEMDRDHYYLVFGEVDQLPGLKILKLGDHYLIQFYSLFWQNHEKQLVNYLKAKFSVPKRQIWVQSRSNSKKPALCQDKGHDTAVFKLKEYGVTYQVNLGEHYDHGIYTDMAAIRKRLIPTLENAKTLLNLYSYTGAFSLFALKMGFESVTSVDLSKKYIDWLESNLALNDFPGSHKSMVKSVDKALVQLVNEKQKFDCLICDPPTSSSDGSKRTNSLNAYKEMLQSFSQLVNRHGHAVLFLNTHSVSLQKFRAKIQQTIKEHKLPFKEVTTVKMNEDCQTYKGFPEGNYLKGLVLKRT